MAPRHIFPGEVALPSLPHDTAGKEGGEITGTGNKFLSTHIHRQALAVDRTESNAYPTTLCLQKSRVSRLSDNEKNGFHPNRRCRSGVPGALTLEKSLNARCVSDMPSLEISITLLVYPMTVFTCAIRRLRAWCQWQRWHRLLLCCALFPLACAAPGGQPASPERLPAFPEVLHLGFTGNTHFSSGTLRQLLVTQQRPALLPWRRGEPYNPPTPG